MRTEFTDVQLADPNLVDAEKSLRACMHCGICTATCPTYVLLGDERDGPRGRIVMMQKMLEEGGTPSDETVLHVDRCLSCLACRTACPSDVDYSRLIDTARAHIETHHRRPAGERLLRWFIARVMTRPNHVRFGVALARFFSPIANAMTGRFGAMARLGANLQSPSRHRQRPKGPKFVAGIAILPGCVQAVVAPEIDDAVMRILARHGQAAFSLPGAGCCGALSHHLGRTDEAKAWAKRNIEAFERAERTEILTAATITATGCAAHLKDYPHLFRGDPLWEVRANAFAKKIVDVSGLLLTGRAESPRALRVAFHSACSAQNGLRLSGEPEALLRSAGFDVVAIPEAHLCCGSAGSYNILQPEIAGQLRARKLTNISSLAPDVIATGNIGCLIQLAGRDAPPVVHYAELLDWAGGGEMPLALRGFDLAESSARR